MLRRPPVCRPVTVLVLAALPWTWFGLRDVLGPPGDVVAILLPVLVGLVTLGLLARRDRRSLLLAVSVLAFGSAAVVGPWTPADAGPVAPGRSVRIAEANVRDSPDPAASLLGVSADVVVVAEMTPALDPPLAAAYPYRELALTGAPNVAVYSRLPLRVLDRPGPDLPGLRLQVDGPAGPFVLYALHVPRPWFTTRGGYQATVGEHHRFVLGIEAKARAETLPVVVTGDLNSPDRGRDYRLLIASGLVDAARADPTTFTSTGQWTALLLRIDHLLVSTGWCGDASGQIPLPGSDHRGVTATVGPCGV